MADEIPRSSHQVLKTIEQPHPFHLWNDSMLNGLQIQSLWLALGLRLHYTLLGVPKVRHVDPHTSFS